MNSCIMNSDNPVYLWSHSHTYGLAAVPTKFNQSASSSVTEHSINNNNSTLAIEDCHEKTTLNFQLSKIVLLCMNANTSDHEITSVGIEAILRILDLHPDSSVQRHALHCVTGIWFTTANAKLKSRLFKRLCEITIKSLRNENFCCVLALLLYFVKVL